jgi:hypothetical protein
MNAEKREIMENGDTIKQSLRIRFHVTPLASILPQILHSVDALDMDNF